MIIVPESAIDGLVTQDDCIAAVEKVFASMAKRTARNFPVVREAIGHADALYGFKSGFDRESLALGLKAGGFWPGNAAKGLTNHQSTVFLFDADTGRCRAVVGGNLLTALRTAAASAISIRHLAREDARVIGMIGAGHQSAFQLRAALGQRTFERVLAWNLHPGMFGRLESVAREHGVPFEAVDLDETFDAIFLINTLEHLDDPVLVLRRIRSWLSPQGRLFVLVPNANAPSRQIAVKMGLISHNSAVTPSEAANGHRNTFSFDTLERTTREAGLSTLQRGGLIFKALANYQFDAALKAGILSDAYVEGCYHLGNQFPDMTASIYLICERGEG